MPKLQIVVLCQPGFGISRRSSSSRDPWHGDSEKDVKKSIRINHISFLTFNSDEMSEIKSSLRYSCCWQAVVFHRQFVEGLTWHIKRKFEWRSSIANWPWTGWTCLRVRDRCYWSQVGINYNLQFRRLFDSANLESWDVDVSTTKTVNDPATSTPGRMRRDLRDIGFKTKPLASGGEDGPRAGSAPTSPVTNG